MDEKRLEEIREILKHQDGLDGEYCDEILTALAEAKAELEKVKGAAEKLSKAGAELFHEIDELMGDTDPIEDDDATIACQNWWKALEGYNALAALVEPEKGGEDGE